DICFDNAVQAGTNAFSALLNCANKGMRLPSASEVLEYVLALGGVTETDWTNDHYAAGSSYAVAAAGLAVGLAGHADGDTLGYRCVTSPHNNAGPTPTGPTRAATSARSAMHLKSR